MASGREFGAKPVKLRSGGIPNCRGADCAGCSESSLGISSRRHCVRGLCVCGPARRLRRRSGRGRQYPSRRAPPSTSPTRSTIQHTDGDRIQVSTAPGADGIVRRIEVRAREAGQNWVVFALANNGDEQIDRLIVAPHYRMVGSGLIWPDLGLSRIVTITPSTGDPPERQDKRHRGHLPHHARSRHRDHLRRGTAHR
jgi:hypothetical protein